MNIFHYHPVTHEYVGASVADESPLEPGNYLIPSHATIIEPPMFSINRMVVFDGSAWVVVYDYRGEVYYLPDGSRHEISALGIAPPLDALSAQPTFYQYDPVTGIYVGVVDDPALALSPVTAVTPPDISLLDIHEVALFDGEAWAVVADYRGEVYYLPDGARHEITDLGIAPPLESSPNPPPPTLDQQRTTLLNAVNSERRWRWRAGFPVQVGGVTKWFHSDEFSLTQHLGLKDKARDVLAAGGAMSDSITIAGQPVYWSTMDGSQVAITAQVVFDMVAGVALQQALVFLASQAHEVAINAAEDLSDYDVLANWPAVFVE